MTNSTEELLKDFPLYHRTCEYLKERSFFYKNVFEQDASIPVNHQLAEEICSDVFRMCNEDWALYCQKLENLLQINIEFLKLQAKLEKTGQYLYSSFAEVEKEVFQKQREDGMVGVEYLWGVIFSHIFWVTHHRLFNFFLDEFASGINSEGICLEAPTGSGIFLSQFLRKNPDWSGVSVDLGETSLASAKRFHTLDGLTGKVECVQQDIYQFTHEKQFDRIICIEFIEHVEDPVGIYRKLRSLLKADGKIFLTTVAWAAFIDHIYLYRNAEEIRAHIRESGLKIQQEYLQNVFPKDEGNLEGDRVALSYSAILTL